MKEPRLLRETIEIHRRVVDAIAAVKTGRNDMPVEDVMISSIDVSVCE